jgi:hypothetical protein
MRVFASEAHARRRAIECGNGVFFWSMMLRARPVGDSCVCVLGSSSAQADVRVFAPAHGGPLPVRFLRGFAAEAVLYTGGNGFCAS